MAARRSWRDTRAARASRVAWLRRLLPRSSGRLSDAGGSNPCVARVYEPCRDAEPSHILAQPTFRLWAQEGERCLGCTLPHPMDLPATVRGTQPAAASLAVSCQPAKDASQMQTVARAPSWVFKYGVMSKGPPHHGPTLAPWLDKACTLGCSYAARKRRNGGGGIRTHGARCGARWFSRPEP